MLLFSDLLFDLFAGRRDDAMVRCPILPLWLYATSVGKRRCLMYYLINYTSYNVQALQKLPSSSPTLTNPSVK